MEQDRFPGTDGDSGVFWFVLRANNKPRSKFKRLCKNGDVEEDEDALNTVCKLYATHHKK